MSVFLFPLYTIVAALESANPRLQLQETTMEL
jgi:hypothetical protein